MKRILFLSLLFVGLFLASCEKQQEPEISFNPSKLVMYQGETSIVNVDYPKTVHFDYSNSRNEATPVFSISDIEGKSTTITALNPGVDTLFISYVYTRGIFAYGEQKLVEITVLPAKED